MTGWVIAAAIAAAWLAVAVVLAPVVGRRLRDAAARHPRPEPRQER